MSALQRFLERAQHDLAREHVAVVTLSAPRHEGQGPRRNANLGRLRAGRVIEEVLGIPHLVSGFREEASQLRRELKQVSKELGLGKGSARLELKSRHTAGNASNVLEDLRKTFGLRSLHDDIHDCTERRPRVVVICTHEWHATRARWLFENIQAYMGATLVDWIGRIPFAIEVVGVESDDLDPDFWVPFAEAEPRKLRDDQERTRDLYRGRLDAAPTILRTAQRSRNAPSAAYSDDEFELHLQNSVPQLALNTNK